MPVEYRKHITRQMLRDEPNALFVFGDNLERRGFGGQAKEMRGEPNAVGIPTKKRPSMNEDSFFTSSDEDWELWLSSSSVERVKLSNHVQHGGKVVWPLHGIGTGLAKLRDKSPRIETSIRNLEFVLLRSSALLGSPNAYNKEEVFD